MASECDDVPVQAAKVRVKSVAADHRSLLSIIMIPV